VDLTEGRGEKSGGRFWMEVDWRFEFFGLDRKIFKFCFERCFETNLVVKAGKSVSSRFLSVFC
jgi:hypothetical protein